MYCAGELFLEVVPVALLVPTKLPKNKLLRARFISYLHRMVECLGAQLLPMLPQTLAALLYRDCDVWDMCSALRVVYQLTVKFPADISELLKELLPLIVFKCADYQCIIILHPHLCMPT
jgi:exportin-T